VASGKWQVEMVMKNVKNLKKAQKRDQLT